MEMPGKDPRGLKAAMVGEVEFNVSVPIGVASAVTEG
jgi:hypothetical protein